MLPSIAQHAKSHGIVPDKKLGQNFLFDLSLCDRIVKSAGNIKNKMVLEIGPGPAGLSRAILACAPTKLFTIEKDTRCIALLQNVKEHFPQLEIINQDALKISLSSLTHLSDPLTIIANLPYNIGTELLSRWLKELEYIESITIMLQKEVVDRICAKPGSKTYGKLSIMCQILGNVEKKFDISPEAFFPPPKVTSSIVRIVPKKEQYSRNIIDNVDKITSLAFNQRRKMLKSSLKNLGMLIDSNSSITVDNILESCSIDPTARAENLTIEDYVRLACHLQN